MAEIIEVGEATFKRKRSKYCSHRHLQYDIENQSIECLDCGEPIGSFAAFLSVIQNFDEAMRRLDRKTQELKELPQKGLHLTAAKKVEKAWRRKNMVPSCPHCGKGILPSDNLGDCLISKEHEIQRRKFESESK